MIPGDEGKPMSIMEAISDEPRDTLPYLDYLLQRERAHWEYWRGINSRDGCRRFSDDDLACVLAKIDHGIYILETIRRKLVRERAGDAQNQPEDVSR